MKRYIDCDGVILNTEVGLFDEYYRLKEHNPDLKRLQYLQQLDWNYWISHAQVLDDAVNILKSHDPSLADILTKVHSLEEACVKIKYFRDLGVKNNIIIVPFEISKSSVVSAKGNILVDDSNTNLFEWGAEGGYSVHYGFTDSEFPKIDTLEDVFDDEKVKRLLLK